MSRCHQRGKCQGLLICWLCRFSDLGTNYVKLPILLCPSLRCCHRLKEPSKLRAVAAFSSELRKAYLFRAPLSLGNVSAPSTHKPRWNHKPEHPRLLGSGISSGATASRRAAAARQLQPLILGPPGTARPLGRQQRRAPAQVRD